MQKRPIILILSKFKLKILWSYRLEFFGQGLHFFVNIAVFVKVIGCMFNQPLMRHIDGTYRSAIAPPVSFH